MSEISDVAAIDVLTAYSTSNANDGAKHAVTLDVSSLTNGEILKTASEDASHVSAEVHHVPTRRRTSSGAKINASSVGHDHKVPVEFVPPTEGTPAAEALAGKCYIILQRSFSISNKPFISYIVVLQPTN